MKFEKITSEENAFAAAQRKKLWLLQGGRLQQCYGFKSVKMSDASRHVPKVVYLVTFNEGQQHKEETGIPCKLTDLRVMTEEDVAG